MLEFGFRGSKNYLLIQSKFLEKTFVRKYSTSKNTVVNFIETIEPSTSIYKSHSNGSFPPGITKWNFIIPIRLIHHSRRPYVERDRDRLRGASLEEGGQATGRCCASYPQPGIGTPWHQTGQYPRIQERLLADQAVRLRRDETREHGGATTQRVAAILAARGTSDRHWRDVQVIIRLTIIRK